MAIMIVLSMLQLKGCDDVTAKEISGFNYGVLIFTTVRGLLFIFLWMCLCNTERNGGEPDAEPEVLHDPHAMDQLDEASTLMPELPLPRAARREPNAEDFMELMIQRCSR